MASSGSFSGSIRDGHYKLRVDWSQSKNVSANTSTVTCKLYLVNDWSLNISGRSDNTCTIDGSAQTFSSPAISSTGTHLLGTVSRTVNHASDGSKSLAISAVFQIRATLSGTYYGTITASANITLDSIPRASSVSAANMTMGSAGTISISRASSAFTHTLTYSFGNTSGTIVTKTTATSVSWTPALSLASQIPNAISGTCTITCTTYNGNTNIGSKTCTLTLSIPASVKPTISSLNASWIDGEVPSTWGIYVQTKSKVKLTINGAAGSYGSTIKSYSITGGGYSGSASTLTTGFLNNSGTITFKATVTDSRGRVSAEASLRGSRFFHTKISKEERTMKEFWNTIQLIFSAVGGWLGYFLGGCDGLLYALIAFVVIDYITGVMCAIINRELSSAVGFKGIFRKVLIFLLVGIANIIDVQVIGTGAVLRTAVIFFYISNEGVSLLENAGHLGLPIPEKIKTVLEQLHDRAENGKEGNE